MKRSSLNLARALSSLVLGIGMCACSERDLGQRSARGSALSVNGPPTRNVSGQFTTIHTADDGTTTTLNTRPPYVQNVRALLVPDAASPTGYTRLQIRLRPDNSFEVPGVPEGSYFLELEIRYVSQIGPSFDLLLIEMTADTPDLSRVSAARPDLARVTTATPVSLSVTNLLPWQGGDAILMSSSQAAVYLRPLTGLQPRPSPGATSIGGTFDWHNVSSSTADEVAGLPDPGHDDVVFFNQRSLRRIGTGDSAADIRYASRYARLTTFAVTDGAASTLSASLIDAPQTGTLSIDARGSEFAALATQVNPAARPSPNANPAVSVIAVPRAVAYPDLPSAGNSSSVFYLQGLTDGSTDVDYGTFSYPQFHDPSWSELRQAIYTFAVSLPPPGGGAAIPTAGFVTSQDPMFPAPAGPIEPVVGPPAAPLLDGMDAFVARSGVGTQPTISWTAPALGVPTSYTVAIYRASQVQPAPGELTSLSATVYSDTTFTVPPGLLQVGSGYYAVITAVQADWDELDRPPFRGGLPIYRADCVTAIFIP